MFITLSNYENTLQVPSQNFQNTKGKKEQKMQKEHKMHCF